MPREKITRSQSKRSLALAKPAREAGVQVTMHKMENVGHDFPAKEYPVVRQWLRDLLK